VLRPGDVGFDPAGKTPCMNLIIGHSLAEEVFEYQITFQRDSNASKIAKKINSQISARFSPLTFPKKAIDLGADHAVDCKPVVSQFKSILDVSCKLILDRLLLVCSAEDWPDARGAPLPS